MDRGIGMSGSLLPSIVLGVASGILSQAGLTAVLVNTDPARRPGWLTGAWIERVALVTSFGEVVANAFVPFLPSRSSGPAWVSRVVAGGGSSALLASTQRSNVLVAAGIGAVTAGLAATASTPLRALLGRFVPDPVVGLAEAVLAIAISRFATRR